MCAAYLLVAYPINFHVHQSSIVYYIDVALPFSINYVLFMYAIPVIGSFFVSSHKSLWVFGGAILGSLVIAFYFKYEQLISVWCFFSALLSVLVLGIVKRQSCKDAA